MKTKIQAIFIPEPLNPEIKDAVATVRGLFKEKNFTIAKSAAQADLIVVVGGDGSLLHALSDNVYPTTPFIGVSSGTLGFLQEIELTAISQLIDCIGDNDYRLSSLPLLQYQTAGGSGVAFNEVVIERASAQTTHLSIAVDGVVFDKFIGDGLIISTPQGSSAYALAAGGAFLGDGLAAMQLVPINPHNTVAYRSLHAPLILPLSATIEITNQNTAHRPIRILTDGIESDVADAATISVSKSDKHATLLRTNGYTYYGMLARKFVK